jgi:hypothetical protein
MSVLAMTASFSRRCSVSEVFYIASYEHIEPGDYIRPVEQWKKGKAFNDMMEEYMELIRQEEFPDRPSRLGAIFLCPTLSICEKEWVGDRPYIFEVEADGDWFMTSGLVFNNIINRAAALHRQGKFGTYTTDKKLLKEIRRYWKGTVTASAGAMPEIVLQGDAVAVGTAWSMGRRASAERDYMATAKMYTGVVQDALTYAFEYDLDTYDEEPWLIESISRTANSWLEITVQLESAGVIPEGDYSVQGEFEDFYHVDDVKGVKQALEIYIENVEEGAIEPYGKDADMGLLVQAWNYLVYELEDVGEIDSTPKYTL